MLNLTTEQISKIQAELTAGVTAANARILDLESQIERLGVIRLEFQEEVKKKQDKQKAAEKALLLVKGVPSKVSQLRNRLLRMLERSKREDITIAKSKSLTAGIAALKTELQKLCSHPFVYREQGYESSPSQERDNRRPEYRYCIVCGLNENGKSSGQYDYIGTRFDSLANADNRIVEDEPWTPEGRKRVNIWLPLGAVLHPFEEEVARVLNS